MIKIKRAKTVSVLWLGIFPWERVLKKVRKNLAITINSNKMNCGQ